MQCSWARPAWPAAVVVVCALGTPLGIRAQAPIKGQAPAAAATAPAASAAAARELVAAMVAAKLEAFAVPDPSRPSRFVAVLYMPKLQLNIVAATYEPTSDIDYFIYQKDYNGAYTSIRSGVRSSSRVLVEDMYCDGLIAMPPKTQPMGDSVLMPTGKRVFDGDIADPKKKGDKRISREDYLKAFSEADAEYLHLLNMLLSGLHKSAPALGSAPRLR